MLPSSHKPPINTALPEVLAQTVNCLPGGPVPAEVAEVSDLQARNSALLLAGAFSEFIATSSRLENSYRELQKEVLSLGHELVERNAALKASVSQNELMRLALQQIVDSMPCGVLVVNRDERISTINPECVRMLGLGALDFNEGSALSLDEISACSGIHLAADATSSTDPESEQELVVRGDGGERWIQIRRRGIFDVPRREGKPSQTILVLRDITMQKRAEQERESGRNAMALAQITTMLAHEIRNPLASLELFAELIEQDDSRRDEWISNLRAGIRSLAGTVNNVLTFHGSRTPALVPVCVPTLIDNALQFVQPLADQAGVSLTFTDGEGDVYVLGNESALNQVLLNLLSNAIRHTPAAGSVSLSYRTELLAGISTVQIVCSDTGCGLRPETMSEIFKPGFSGGGDSSGLGLAVCERILQQHGGLIAATNLPSSGASFLVSLPTVSQKGATA